MKVKAQSTPHVEARNLQRRIAVNALDLQRFAQKAAALCLQFPSRKKTDLEELDQISVLIISDRRIAALHRRFMNELGPTDVLTFQHGEIFISVETALRNARRFGNALARELELYVVHGLLHLNGFDDRDPAGTRKMRAAEKKILHRLRR
jgi:probable rRNA maturation factor